MFATAIRYFAKKSKPKMRPVSLKTPPEQRQTITRTLFDIVNEHGPLTIGETWQRVQDVGLKDLTSKTHMKLVLKWMKQRQKLRLVCNHVGAHKQFLYTTWFTKPNTTQATTAVNPPKHKSS
ncbi:thiamine-phosphate synthase [Senna tora]|uniref:Thiamine-phosphate synthase n=1 Tax=Senna tora TaxID=362788 RepID=A0A834T3E3_9FABA|nr:thiamine-phosphate synthase [Senna tora]